MTPLSDDELLAQAGTALPDKEVASVLDLNADLDLGINAAAPIDLAVAANANVAAPIDAAASANILSFGSESQALADQGVIIDQGITADATADSVQDSTIGQGPESVDGGTPDSTGSATLDGGDSATTGPNTVDGGEVLDGAVPAGTVPDGTVPDVGALPADPSSALDGDLLNVNVDLAADADIAAPINGAVAANANVAAPIDAAVAANIGSIDSDATAVSQQDAIITQNIDGSAAASADQQSDLQQ
ncbi:peptidoglycan-binding protein [Arthrobacter sp. Bi83]|uniref:peptidoglycan-binding protein n=1 Tax=Arthrobacter sp. Bi83 TaxID=2822353 RepID=UPI001E533FBE|nr:peptidoglycan-binding protein [Arthrobacter sp. Bi83]